MTPKRITVHATATAFNVPQTVKDITRMHRKRGWRTIGYHRLVRLDGTVEQGRPLTQQGAHVYGHNRDNIGIALVGGLDKDGKPANTFSDEMLDSLFYEILGLCEKYDIDFKDVCGHRDYSPDLNGNGIIEPNEFIKECPCFDTKTWFMEKLRETFTLTE